MRVALADDDPKVQSAVELLLEQLPGVEMTGFAIDATEVMALVSGRAVEILLLDWELPGCDCGWVRKLASLLPAMLIIALSGRPQARSEALECGCSAFVSKGEPPERLISVLEGFSDPRTGRG